MRKVISLAVNDIADYNTAEYFIGNVVYNNPHYHYPKNVIRSEAMLFLMAAIRKVYWQDVDFQDIGNFVAQKLSQL